MRMEHIFIAVAIFGLFITVGYNVFLDQNNNYDLNANEELFSPVLRNISTGELEEAKEGLREDTQTKEVSDTSTDEEFYTSGYPGILSIFNFLPLIGKSLGLISNETGLLAPEIKEIFMSILGVLVATFVLYMIWRFKPSKD